MSFNPAAAFAPGSPAGGLPSFTSTAASSADGYFGGSAFDNGGFTVNMKGATAAGGAPSWLLIALAVGVGLYLWKR